LIISVFAGSNRVSLSLALFLLLALFVPTQLPAAAEKGWAGELLLRVNPVTAGERYVGRIIVEGHPWTKDASWLVSPLVAAALFALVAMLVGARFLRLHGRT
ncbi:MAG: ABC transporter permease, partial [Actinomycetota bacterium]|nr:ABC transporter permease [Actinomycetota bacterium]